jgi:tetratricopeptide (TPR) repeat protein
MLRHEIADIQAMDLRWILAWLIGTCLQAQSLDFDSLNQAQFGRIRSGDSSVISELHQTRSLAFLAEEQSAYVGALKNLGSYYLIFEDLDSADHFLRVGLAEPLEDTACPARASMLMYYGLAAQRSGLLERAYLRYQRALVIAELAQDSLRMASVLLNLANVDFYLDRYEKAIELLQEAMEYRGHQLGWSLIALNNLGANYLYTGDTAAAESSFQEVIERSRSVPDSMALSQALIDLGGVHSMSGRFESALPMLEEALEIAERLSQGRRLAEARNALATHFKQEGKYELALAQYQEVIQSTRESEPMVYALLNMSQCLEEKGRSKEALNVHKRWSGFRDSVNSHDRAIKMSDLEQQLEKTKNAKKNELEARNRELLLSRRISWLTIGLLLALFLFSLFLLRRKLHRAAARRNELIEMQEREKLELQLLRSQMNPHFFFNALYSIQNFILGNQPLESSRFLSKLARLMRATLEWNEKELISLDNELKILNDYLELEVLRFDDKFRFEIECEDQLRESASIPPMIIQPFLENAIKHGFRGMEKDGLLELKINEDGEALKIEVLDNGVGLKGQTEQATDNFGGVEKTSVALGLTDKRLAFLSKKYDFHCSRTLKNRSDVEEGATGVRVELILPLIED